MNRRFVAFVGVRPGEPPLAPSVVEDGPLLLFHDGPPPAAAGSVLCLLDGVVDDVPALAAEVGERPGTGAEAVLAAGWARLGPGMLDRLRGEWALFVWDRERRLALAACDRLGSRTIHHTHSGSGVIMGSEAREVVDALPVRPGPDDAAMAHWLSGGGPPGARTVYAGVLRLPGGHAVTSAGTGASATRWWRPRFEEPAVRSLEDAGAAVRERLRTAVGRAAGGGGESGVLLSGGIDSGAVAAVLAEGGARPGARAYSAVFPDHPQVDESALIDEMVPALGLRSARVEGRTGPLLDAALEYLAAWELPALSPNLSFWLPLLRGAAAEGTTVMLDGEGGDELFGVARWLLADRVRDRRPLAAWALARRFPGAGERPSRRILARVMRDYGVLGALPHGLHEVNLRGPWIEARTPPYLLPRTTDVHRVAADEWRWVRGDGPRWWLGLIESLTGADGPAPAREHVRLRSRMTGIEPRHPLLDADLVDLVLSLDPELAFDPHLSRPVLRAAVAGMLPDRVRLRPSKSTFDAVFQQSLIGPEAARIRRLLTAPDAEIRRYTDPAGVARLLDPAAAADLGGRRRWALLLWRLVTAELFLRHQADPALPGRLAEMAD